MRVFDGRRTVRAMILAAWACGMLGACDASTKDDKDDSAKAKKPTPPAQPEMTPEELAEARRAAGFKSADDLAAENAAMFEKGAREWIKTRLPEYRALIAEWSSLVDEVEKSAPKWKTDADFEKFEKKYKERVKAMTKTYDRLTAKGSEGGNTQATLGAAFRSWEDFNGGLGVGVADSPRLAEVITEFKTVFEDVGKALDDIEKDETLSPDPEYQAPKPAKKGK